MVTALDPKTALILVDFQKMITLVPLLTPASVILANAANLVTAFRKAGLPVVVVTVDLDQASVKDADIRRDAKRTPAGSYSPEVLELASEIQTEPGDIFIAKPGWSAFNDTPLDEELKKRGVTGIVLAGVSTSIGVEATARSASERGYNIAFAQDAMTDIIVISHENSLTHIFPRIGEVDDTKAIIAMLENVSKTEK